MISSVRDVGKDHAPIPCGVIDAPFFPCQGASYTLQMLLLRIQDCDFSPCRKESRIYMKLVLDSSLFDMVFWIDDI